MPRDAAVPAVLTFRSRGEPVRVRGICDAFGVVFRCLQREAERLENEERRSRERRRRKKARTRT